MTNSKISKPKTARQTFTQEQMHAAFTAVQNKKDWKNRIDALIDPKDEAVTDAAINHFAYGGAFFTEAPGGKLRVEAPGYYGMEAQMGG